MRIRGMGVAALVSAAILWGGAGWAQSGEETTVPAAAATSASTAISKSTADHSKFEILKQNFKSGPEVTAACLSCHTEASNQVMHSIHWKWDYEQPETGQRLGKAHTINSFCGNVASNETRCTSCHAGYGWTDVRQPAPADPARVDCLVCHDKSGQYTKQDNLAGNPPLDPVTPGAKTITGADVRPVNLSQAAQSVGAPGRENCGSCHFNGGGGDNVKHGDLSSALIHPDLATDVHMSADGANFTCESCHVSDKHVFAGSRYATNVTNPHPDIAPGAARDVASCTSCHGEKPHPDTSVSHIKLNDHTDTIACQTCHIPSFARGGVATKTSWDWSTAGRLDNGKPISMEGYTQGNGKHLHTYLSTKGDFEWGENVVPYYAWFDGQVEYTNTDHTIDPSKTVDINIIHGNSEDPKSRIFPFKRMEGRQAYDTEMNRLVMSNVYGPTTDTAFWTNFDWTKSIKAAMDYAGLEYSGKFDFVDTHMYWPITHMVAPAKDALSCQECHSQNGRLANVAGIYMPGSGPGIGGKLGMVMVALALLGALGHGGLRLMRRARGNGGAHHD